jgi:hypothetical protein
VTHRVYYNIGDDENRETFMFEVDDLQYQTVVANLHTGGVDLDDAFEKALAMLSANVRINDEDIDQDILEAQVAATATVWFLMNEAADHDDRVAGDILLIEKDGELFVTDAGVENAEDGEDEDSE